jgi:MSHA biogenesis protein MshL
MKRKLILLLLLVALSACAAPSARNGTAETIRHEMDAAVRESSNAGKTRAAVEDALLPPLAMDMPAGDVRPPEVRFDLTVNDTPARQVFMAIVSGTRYSMLVSPDVGGSISLNLKDVTVFDALEAVRNLYGYDYKVDGTRIYIQPMGLQTRIYQVNYLTGLREGRSSLRVTSGSVSDTPIIGVPGMPVPTTTTATGSSTQDSSRVTTKTTADFWEELGKALNIIVGSDKGRSVVISPMTGVIVVRAMPDELRNVAAYLKASQISVERQVILEAKIIEVQLNDGFQSGVNWSAFNGGGRGSVGQLGTSTTLAPNAAGGAAQTISNPLLAAVPGSSIASSAATVATNAITGVTQGSGTLFGMAFQTNNFAALLNFLETQGDVHVLSSPRIATLNDQKAVLKVGTDEFFVTNVTSTTTTGTATTTTPSVTLQPFFSGIALDVTPSIDENNDVILHVHPSVSVVTTVTKTVTVGGTGGTLSLPLASSSVSETDSIVRAHDGQIVVIGGLMRQATTNDNSGLPGMPKTLFGQTNMSTQKRELIILLKPTVVDSNKDWAADIASSRDRVDRLVH